MAGMCLVHGMRNISPATAGKCRATASQHVLQSKHSNAVMSSQSQSSIGFQSLMTVRRSEKFASICLNVVALGCDL